MIETRDVLLLSYFRYSFYIPKQNGRWKMLSITTVQDLDVYGTESRPLYAKRIRTHRGKENVISLPRIQIPVRRSMISNIRYESFESLTPNSSSLCKWRCVSQFLSLSAKILEIAEE